MILTSLIVTIYERLYPFTLLVSEYFYQAQRYRHYSCRSISGNVIDKNIHEEWKLIAFFN